MHPSAFLVERLIWKIKINHFVKDTIIYIADHLQEDCCSQFSRLQNEHRQTSLMKHVGAVIIIIVQLLIIINCILSQSLFQCVVLQIPYLH